jgi:hypothetical protein
MEPQSVRHRARRRRQASWARPPLRTTRPIKVQQQMGNTTKVAAHTMHTGQPDSGRSPLTQRTRSTRSRIHGRTPGSPGRSDGATAFLSSTVAQERDRQPGPFGDSACQWVSEFTPLSARPATTTDSLSQAALRRAMLRPGTTATRQITRHPSGRPGAAPLSARPQTEVGHASTRPGGVTSTRQIASHPSGRVGGPQSGTLLRRFSTPLASAYESSPA